MTAERDYRDFLEDLVGACRSIIGFVEGMSFETYLADEKTRFAVMRGYEIMGEAPPNVWLRRRSMKPLCLQSLLRDHLLI